MTLIFNRENQTDLRRKLRNNMSKPEAVLWKYINHSQTGFKFRRQCGIGGYVADFYCPEVKLVVELDGISHYNLKSLAHDEKRTQFFTSLGLHVKRYSAKQVFLFVDEVVVDLENICKELRGAKPPRSPRATTPPSQGGDSKANSKTTK